MHACVLPFFGALKVQNFSVTNTQKSAAATLYRVGYACSTPVLPAALLGLDALLSPLALVPLDFLPFLPSAAFMGVLPEQSTFSCTGLNMRGSMRGGRSSNWKLARLSFVCRLAPVCNTVIAQTLMLKIAEHKFMLSSCLNRLPVKSLLNFISVQWHNAQMARANARLNITQHMACANACCAPRANSHAICIHCYAHTDFCSKTCLYYYTAMTIPAAVQLQSLERILRCRS